MPPPLPPAPPPVPKQLFGAPVKPNNFEPAPDRNALLSQIQKGKRLKKTETNDRSSPLVDGKRSVTNEASKRPMETKSNGPLPLIPPGGLFAQGIPKLRPTTPRSGDNPTMNSMSSIINSRSGNGTSGIDRLRVGQLSGGSRSQPPSPVSKPRMSSGVSNKILNSDTSEHSSLPSGNPNFPDDVNLKGRAPMPPPASQKPMFKPSTDSEHPRGPSTVKRSASQTNIGQRPRLTRPPPNVKPPPPPKSNNPPAPPSSAPPPPPPSKPPNILRRQSFGVGESQNSQFGANKQTYWANNSAQKSSSGQKIISGTNSLPPPPPPPRNNSAPNDLNQLLGSSSPQVFSMNIAPPPPPNRTVVTSSRSAPLRPPPPRAAAPPPPPPPQHHFNTLPAPPSQLKASLSSGMAPPPPARVSSVKSSLDFEDRFKFHPAQSLPRPERYSNIQKHYPSKANRQRQSVRRLPPPPPPTTGNQSLLHIQLTSGILSNHN